MSSKLVSSVTKVTEKLSAKEYALVTDPGLPDRHVPVPRAGVNPRQEADVYGFHDFETATELAEQKTNETGRPHCVLPAEDVDGPGGMFTLGVYPQSMEIPGFIKKIMG
ncbi:MAG: hypothetical protein WA728_28995, partial [Xanthobacteraceae bacterium]